MHQPGSGFASEPDVTNICNEAGIPVVYINREPDAEREQAWVDDGIKATYVGADARQSGTYQGEEIAELENKGDADGDGVVRYIMVQGDPENVDAQYRTEKSVEALKAAGVEVEELTKQRGDWDQTKGQEITANASVPVRRPDRCCILQQAMLWLVVARAELSRRLEEL
ncbi:MAG: substrate-binding domain-containing protein [Clostridium fessum]